MINNTFIKIISTLLIVILTNIFVNETCNYIGCNHWSVIFGHNLICNYCIDYIKAIKDYQFMLYGTIITTLTFEFNKLTEKIKSELK